MLSFNVLSLSQWKCGEEILLQSGKVWPICVVCAFQLKKKQTGKTTNRGSFISYELKPLFKNKNKKTRNNNSLWVLLSFFFSCWFFLLFFLFRQKQDEKTNNSNLVDPASVICLSQRLSHACLSISFYTVKLRMAHYISYSLFDSAFTWITVGIRELIHANGSD